jgi:hypothetical protein
MLPHRPSPRALSLALCLVACGAPAALQLAACGGPASPIVLTAPPPSASASGPLAAASASAPAASSSAAAPLASAPEDESDGGPDEGAGSIDTDIPPAPCDLSRPYRGEIGKKTVSVILARSGDALRGATAYDGNTGEIELVGTAAEGKFTLTERKDRKDLATMRGSCEAATGILAGTWNQGTTTLEFRLRPRAAGGVGIAQRVKQIGTPSEEQTSCTWKVRSPVVFGLGNAERTARINTALRIQFPNETDMERQILACGPKVDRHVNGWYSIEANAGGLLSVLLNGYTYMGPAAHGDWNAGGAAVSLDIPTGRRLALKDIVTSSKALRPLIKSCMPFAGNILGWNEWQLEQSIQGVEAEDREPSSVRDPSFLVLPDGLAVLMRNMPTVGAIFEFQGVVVRWGALQRAGLLAPRSPVARLWANQPALAPGDAACARMFFPRWIKPPKEKTP